MGFDISRFEAKSHVLARRKSLLKFYAIDTVIDVGANIGQFAIQMRKDLGFSGNIISFEPLSSAFEVLKINAAGDPKWRVLHCALGDAEGRREISIAKNSYSSSFLNMLPTHAKSAPKSVYTGRELTEIRTLDSMMNDLCSMEENIYLKIDTQGFEGKVIKGAENSLERISSIQLEMSLIPLYQDGLLFAELNSLLNKKGYSLVSIEPGFSDENSGQLLQVDGIYHRF
jgi:FkbM family methyltransferase